MLNKIDEAIDFAVANGLLKYNTNFELTHAPLCLTPCSVSEASLAQLRLLTPVFNHIWLRIANNTDFLKNALEKTAYTDDFVRNLLNLLPDAAPDASHQLLISRNDFLLTGQSGSQGSLQLLPKQVEFNTISNSFPFLSRQIVLMHRYLHLRGLLDCSPVLNDPLEEVVDTMAHAIRLYDHPDSCMLMVVQRPEQNIFDQRAIEYRLLEKYEISTQRLTMEEIAERGQLRDGHLLINGQVAALVYFRAGYSPADYTVPEDWKAREMIESASAIKCPSIGMQLAGAKKIQQLLGNRETLKMFADDKWIEPVKETFVGLYALDEAIDGVPIMDAAARDPGRFVLKPQREGGGNNLYDEALKSKLRTMSASEQHAFILMERIEAIIAPAELVVETVCEELPSVSEIGRYGICLADGDDIIENRDAGYLVRTKSADVNEGGVCAGYACLNSLCLSS